MSSDIKTLIIADCVEMELAGNEIMRFNTCAETDDKYPLSMAIILLIYSMYMKSVIPW